MSEPIHRTRAALALFAGVAVSAMGYTILITFIPLAAEDLLGSPRWSGVPSALGTAGTAFGAAALARVMAVHGRRRGLVLGYLGSAAAAVAAAGATSREAFFWLAASVFGIGMGYSASRLSRYVAADLYDPGRRSVAIGWNVWGAVLGSVAGPLLLSPIVRWSGAIGVPLSTAPFLAAALAFALAAAALRLLYPELGRAVATATAASGAGIASREGIRLAIVSLVAGQVVMILIMTMTPVHIRAEGHPLHSVGAVIASHTFGMYALSPVAGYLGARFGRTKLIALAAGALGASGLLAAQADAGSPLFAVALFLLGLGWSFNFVSASALLSESAPGRIRLQGLSDLLVWGSAALAAIASGLLLSGIGYAGLSRMGAILALTPLAFLRPSRTGKADLS